MKKLSKTLKNSEKAITLIALVITIIVLLILAGISISMLTGDNGLLKRAVDSKENTEIATLKEQAELAKNSLIIERKGDMPTRGEIVEAINSDNYFSGSTKNGNIITTSDDKYDILVDKDLSIIVAKHGEIEDPLEAGLYDINTGNLKMSWEELIKEGGPIVQSGGKITTHYDNTTGGDSSAEILDGKLVIADTVSSIETNAFSKCNKLVEVYIPTSVQTVRSASFSGCDGLKTVVVGAKEIIEGTFSNCPNIEEIQFLKGVEKVRMGAFGGPYAIRTLTFPDGMKELSDGAFGNCEVLTEITIPDSIEKINMGVFNLRYKLKTKVNTTSSIALNYNWKAMNRIMEEEYIKAGEKAPSDKNAAYTDGKYTAIIPAGFTVSDKDGENEIEKGLVIKDDDDNEFVWIPVGISKENTTINLSRYVFNVNGSINTAVSTTNPQTRIQLGASYNTECLKNSTLKDTNGNAIAKDIQGFVTNANSYGGYYIGRYEARKDNNGNLTEKGNDSVYVQVTQPESAEKSRAMYENNSYFESDLMNSFAWDTATLFLQTFGNNARYSWQTSLRAI